MIIGITVLPARFTRVAPAGTRTSAAAPAWAIFAPSTTNVAFSITRPSPTISRAPSYAVTDRVGRRNRASGKETKGNDCRDCDHIKSAHGNLLYKNMRFNAKLSRAYKAPV